MNGRAIEQRKRVLIVDDEPDLIRTVSLRLQRAGYEVLSAADGVMATQVAVSQQPDAIVLDIGLPGGDGHKVAQRLRNNGRTGVIPIIYVTARTSQDDLVTARRNGAFGYLVKPYEPAELLALVKKATSGEGPDDAGMVVSDTEAVLRSQLR